MKHEVAPYPLSLFDNLGMWKTLYDLFTESTTSVIDVRKFSCVIDGGMLLHRVRWELNKQFQDKFKHHISYLHDMWYGGSFTLVFSD